MLRPFWIVLLIVGLVGPASADYDRGATAMMMLDYATALKEFREAANG